MRFKCPACKGQGWFEGVEGSPAWCEACQGFGEGKLVVECINYRWKKVCHSLTRYAIEEVLSAFDPLSHKPGFLDAVMKGYITYRDNPVLIRWGKDK